MFTGIISDVGKVGARQGGRLSIVCGYPADSIVIGASIACDGCCLTVTDLEAQQDGGCAFAVDVSNETLASTTLGAWKEGRLVNLERALTLRDELGGHMVTGHVDAATRIAEIGPDGESSRFTLDCPRELAQFIARKGSVALDGISLTVNDVAADSFEVNLVPHTLRHTTWGEKKAGDAVNLEVDLLSRYVARITQMQQSD